MIIKDKCLCQPYVLLHHWSVVHIGEGLIRYWNAKELHSCTDFVWFYFALVFTNINIWMWLIFFVLCCWHPGTLQRGSQPCFTCHTSSLSAGTSLITCPHKIVVAYFAQISCFCRFVERPHGIEQPQPSKPQRSAQPPPDRPRQPQTCLWTFSITAQT